MHTGSVRVVVAILIPYAPVRTREREEIYLIIYPVFHGTHEMIATNAEKVEADSGDI